MFAFLWKNPATISFELSTACHWKDNKDTYFSHKTYKKYTVDSSTTFAMLKEKVKDLIETDCKIPKDRIDSMWFYRVNDPYKYEVMYEDSEIVANKITNETQMRWIVIIKHIDHIDITVCSMIGGNTTYQCYIKKSLQIKDLKKLIDKRRAFSAGDKFDSRLMGVYNHESEEEFKDEDIIGDVLIIFHLAGIKLQKHLSNFLISSSPFVF